MSQDIGTHMVCIVVLLNLVVVTTALSTTIYTGRGWTVGLKYADCRKMCERKVNCDIVRYIKRYPLCTLHNKDDTNPSREPGVTTRLEKQPEIVSSCSVCNGTDFCDISANSEVICTPAQCQVPGHVPGAEVKGNMLALGSKVQYKCKDTSTVYPVQCLPTGSWSGTSPLLCNCRVPDGDHHATTGLEMVNDSYIALTLDCHSGYELLEMDKPKCNLKTGEWFGLDLSGCYRMVVPPWRKIFSFTSKPSGSIVGEFLRGMFFIDNLQPNGQFRDSNIFDNWSESIQKRIRFNVVVNWEVVKYMIFNGTNSTMLTWFSGSRLLESSWTDLNSSTETYLFEVYGLNQPWNLRFIVNKQFNEDQTYKLNCGDDSGWFTVCWRYYPCDTNALGIVILYAKGTTSAKFVSNELGSADRIDIWIEE